MIILAYIASLAIGLSLGLLGGGGSILTVPVLVYLFGIDPVSATAYSLFIVGATSAGAIIPKAIQGLVDFKVALWFGAPSVLMVYITRAWILPAIPTELILFGDFSLTKGTALMLLFAIMMLWAGRGMIKDPKPKNKQPDISGAKRVAVIFFEGALIGLLTGLIGAGGGFLIIPALVLVTGLNMKVAVGTSLTIIAFKSLLGFTGDMDHMVMDWNLLLTVTAVALVGMLIGNHLSNYVNTERLKKAFGIFVLSMGCLVIVLELNANSFL
ncbi:MAG: sulfite exporter TauE/SafE family protein [Flavobacteriales bacterium]|nr:sulfite exporter TauE/SafE family protein [Flavobacteriales bacterium]